MEPGASAYRVSGDQSALMIAATQRFKYGRTHLLTNTILTNSVCLFLTNLQLPEALTTRPGTMTPAGSVSLTSTLYVDNPNSGVAVFISTTVIINSNSPVCKSQQTLT